MTDARREPARWQQSRPQQPGSPGRIRPSQLITAFGPGSLVQTEHDSVIIMGPGSWSKSASNYKTLRHAYLEALLGKSHFRMPAGEGAVGAAVGARVVTCRSFPTWGVCSNPKCRILQRHHDAPPARKAQFSCDYCRYPLYPARFVVMCERGHLDDFPWIEWAHSKSKSECGQAHPVLRLRALGKSTALSDYYVMCDSCGARRSCGRAVSRGGLAGIADRCSGLSPWLGDDEAAPCTGGKGGKPAEPYGVQTLSTSLYYPSTVSALYIPKMLHKIQKVIDLHKDAIDGARAMNSDRDIAERHPLLAGMREQYGAAEVAAQLKERYAPTGAGGAPLTKASTEMDIRRIEYDDLAAAGEFDGGEHLQISNSRLDAAGMPGHVSSLKQVWRLTVIAVIRSFTRGIAPDPYSPEDDAEVHFCPIAGHRMDWYPAVENRGEGILFSLSEPRLRAWEQKPDVVRRCNATIDAVVQWNAEHGWSHREAPRPRYLLVHTISHMINRELAHKSGYSEASIRERLYCGDDYNAILLYTASPSSDGSLGGLVGQGDAGRFGSLLASAVRRSRSCSNDPLCADDDPVAKRSESVPVHARLNGSSCYGCTLLPETSCENANRLLDRTLVSDPELGFFSEVE